MSEPILKLTAGNLAALLCARICHDLVSPVGALTAALEVFDDDDNIDMRDDAMELIRLSAGQASAKLQFLRLAFGAGGSAPGIVGTEELKRLTFGVYGSAKATIDWQIKVDGLDKSAARLLLNLVMLAVMSVPRGGDIVVSADVGAEKTSLKLVCTGPKARLDIAVVSTLGGGAPELGFDGRSIQPFYTGMIARESGGEVTAVIDEETVTFAAHVCV
ncbi:MAG: hypothetical protein COA43_08620 [Robiginitomaculum sp.]|nr:MAG: hypothetical protein COA43_08620 [Robiginitomaculum sp.]